MCHAEAGRTQRATRSTSRAPATSFAVFRRRSCARLAVALARLSRRSARGDGVSAGLWRATCMHCGPISTPRAAKFRQARICSDIPLEDLFGMGLARYFMGPGDNPYKARWTEQGEPVANRVDLQPDGTRPLVPAMGAEREAEVAQRARPVRRKSETESTSPTMRLEDYLSQDFPARSLRGRSTRREPSRSDRVSGIFGWLGVGALQIQDRVRTRWRNAMARLDGTTVMRDDGPGFFAWRSRLAWYGDHCRSVRHRPRAARASDLGRRRRGNERTWTVAQRVLAALRATTRPAYSIGCMAISHWSCCNQDASGRCSQRTGWACTIWSTP